MNTKHTTRSSVDQIDELSEALAANNQLAQKIAKLERRAASHDLILNFFETILDQVKETGSLQLTDDQRDELNRWLADYERIMDGGLHKSEIN